jgi:hypothetical protein
MVPGAERVEVIVDSREVGACESTFGPTASMLRQNRTMGEYSHVTSFTSELIPVSEFWFELPGQRGSFVKTLDEYKKEQQQ